MGKQKVYNNSDVKCGKCNASIKFTLLVKLKDRFCCPYCFSTVNVKKGK